MSKTEKFDIAIVGSGLIGTSLVCALKHLPLSIAVIEAVPSQARCDETFDSRAIALSPASKNIFSALGCWESIQANALDIDKIHVSDRGYFGVCEFDRTDAGGQALGHVVSAHLLQAAILRTAKEASVKWICPAKVVDVKTTWPARLTLDTGLDIEASLVIAADGANSFMRRSYDIPATVSDYRQTALVANIGLQRPHNNIAYERFTQHGPLALLPLAHQRSGLVWALPPELAKAHQDLPDEAFLKSLQQAFGYRLGRFAKVGARFSYPLSHIRAKQACRPGFILLGNAQHALHPIAGQGFNLGLRDVATLAQVITWAHQQNTAIGSLSVLESYLAQRQRDQDRVQQFCDFVPRVFSNAFLPLAMLRDIGLCVVDRLPPLKRKFLQQNMGFVGPLSDLACELALDEKL